MLVLKSILTLITILLVIIHFAILYFWIFDWQQLVTQVGLISWIGSIILGILVYFVYYMFIRSQKFTVVSRRVLFSSTLMIIILGVLALVIESITRSMPQRECDLLTPFNFFNGCKIHSLARDKEHFFHLFSLRYLLIQFKKTMPEQVIIQILGCYTLKPIHPLFQTSMIPVDVLNMVNSFLCNDTFANIDGFVL